MKEFKGRIVASGTVTAKALVSHWHLSRRHCSSAIKKQPAEIRITPISTANRWRARPCACRRPSDLPPADWYFTVPAP